MGKLFVVCVFLFLGHQVMQKSLDISVPLIDSYLDPLLMMPIVLTLLTWERRILLRRPDYLLSLTHCLGYTLLVAVIAEFIFPLWTNRFVADIWDVFCYVLGTSIFLVVTRNLRARKRAS